METNMFIVGLTGGIGSGKTAASDIFASQGIHIVDADVVAREVVAPGSEALTAIVRHFGEAILNPDASLNRAELRQRIFSHSEEKKWLEALLHPIIRLEIQQQLGNAQSEYAILVSPLLFETDQANLVNRTLLIDVPVDLQMQRATSRDQNTPRQIQKIIDSQLPREVKLARADDIICNDRSLNELRTHILKKHTEYLELAREQNT